MTQPPVSAHDLEKAREMLRALTDINTHMGYQFTQPLMMAVERVAQALSAARAEGAREERDACAKRIEASRLAKGHNIVRAAYDAFKEAENTVLAGWTSSSTMEARGGER
jgi:hypothetical protein